MNQQGTDSEQDRRRRALWTVQARLREWGMRIREEPTIPISPAYGAQTPPTREALASQPERWVMSRDQVLAVDRMVKALPTPERRVVELRYLELAHWRYIARSLHVSTSRAFRIHEMAVTLLAQAMGLLGGESSEEAA